MKPNRLAARLLGIFFLVAQFGALGASQRPDEASSQFDIVGPAGSSQFGSQIAALANGNILIVDSAYNGNIGAVYLYNGATHAQISQLIGSHSGDQVGSGGFQQLNSTTVLIFSPHWANGGAANAGAVTRLNASMGVNGPVGPANSLVGDQTGDALGSDGVTELANGNYVIVSSRWRSGGVLGNGYGAVTWANANTGISGTVSAANSLIGDSVGDQVGFDGVTELKNGNYVVGSSQWHNFGVFGNSRGAVTWVNGTTGLAGFVSAANSLVGDQVGDQVGNYGITTLNNGNYVVDSGEWRGGGGFSNGLGAVTWVNAHTGLVGAVSAANSLVGSQAGDRVGETNGSKSVNTLDNGNYVVISTNWANSGFASAGAVTWANGTTGLVGAVSASNSLVGDQTGDQVGLNGVTTLKNGNYLVDSGQWHGGFNPGNGFGAVTWANETTGVTGPVSSTNSLIGSQTGDQVGAYNTFGNLYAFSNGNYLVISPDWNTNAGAVTWGDGNTGSAGVVAMVNSLVGTQNGDLVGSNGEQELNNGKYVISSPLWARGGVIAAGAATLADSAVAITGVVTVTNSLVGSQANDQVSSDSVSALSNGNYVVVSSNWANDGAGNAGAVTWGNGNTGVIGPVSPANSLVGSQTDDRVGSQGITRLNVANAAYLVRSPNWKNSGAVSAGAVTWANGTSAITGPVSPANSVVGDQANDQVGSGPIAIPNLNAFVVRSPRWHSNRGAATWGNAGTGVVGLITSSNSLIGSQPGDSVSGELIRTGFANGNYVVDSPSWANGPITKTGALTWGNGNVGTSGVVSVTNSLVGSQVGDKIGANGLSPLASDSYVVKSVNWANGGAVKAGAVSLLPGTGPTAGPINSSNSVLGVAPNGGSTQAWALDCTNQQLVVARPADNIVTLFKGAPVCIHRLYLPALSRH